MHWNLCLFGKDWASHGGVWPSRSLGWKGQHFCSGLLSAAPILGTCFAGSAKSRWESEQTSLAKAHDMAWAKRTLTELHQEDPHSWSIDNKAPSSWLQLCACQSFYLLCSLWASRPAACHASLLPLTAFVTLYSVFRQKAASISPKSALILIFSCICNGLKSK